jgi:hypothetical protein
MLIICDLRNQGRLAAKCRGHHREIHRFGNEAAWWKKVGVDPTVPARALWLESHPLPTASGDEQSRAERDQTRPERHNEAIF